ncbi:hypothetical protein AMTR_s00057p00206030 [Amborella trichopoda]|uniref:Homeobox domain-containing protein n=1 Tax=Amborella trichopoda TaxID=13333 RepID=U5D6D6_AMBTC|nr:hypothetical protein AMTR_s00057p00206030 [Amborella trichopoda]
MERPKEVLFAESDIGNSFESFERCLESQKELFHYQIEQLEKIVASQCKLTGANPLSNEMAAGALSIKIGKRPRDLLNPKAVKYMQAVFSIKDTLSKKETREISALCGVTVTQVREFFASQRSRVRKLFRLTREKAMRNDNACEASLDGPATNSEHTIHASEQPIEQPLEDLVEQATSLNVVKEDPSCSLQGDVSPGIEPSDSNFLENIFSLMRKEETYAGQVKLMEWILQIRNSAVLYWFSTKGGIVILAKWLSEAASEEQTTVLLVIFKVLCHLPFHKALPVQISAILQTVNKLRFYRTSAHLLIILVRPSWSRINEILSDGSWQSKIDIPEEILAPTDEIPENCRKSEPPNSLKLLPNASDDSNRRLVRIIPSSQAKERRKVLLVEQPSRKRANRNVQVARAASEARARPLSADDIQKAKMRAVFMQGKHCNDGVHKSTQLLKPRVTKPPSLSQSRKKLNDSPLEEPDFEPTRPEVEPLSRASQRIRDPESSGRVHDEPTRGSDLGSGICGPLSDQLRQVQTAWRTPPEMRINCLWRVGAGEKSKEMEIQTERIRRERETIYRFPYEIPPNPKEPWDVELDYDDSLTLEIPSEQANSMEAVEEDPQNALEDTISQSLAACSNKNPSDGNDPTGDTSSQRSETNICSGSQAASINGTAGPDLELLAVLLKNPELVFALTSGQGKNISNSDTVVLLDMLKASNVGMGGTKQESGPSIPRQALQSGGAITASSSAKVALPEIRPSPSISPSNLGAPSHHTPPSGLLPCSHPAPGAPSQHLTPIPANPNQILAHLNQIPAISKQISVSPQRILPMANQIPATQTRIPVTLNQSLATPSQNLSSQGQIPGTLTPTAGKPNQDTVLSNQISATLNHIPATSSPVLPFRANPRHFPTNSNYFPAANSPPRATSNAPLLPLPSAGKTQPATGKVFPAKEGHLGFSDDFGSASRALSPIRNPGFPAKTVSGIPNLPLERGGPEFEVWSPERDPVWTVEHQWQERARGNFGRNLRPDRQWHHRGGRQRPGSRRRDRRF